jgi:carboxyl-terminal processing protease
MRALHTRRILVAAGLAAAGVALWSGTRQIPPGQPLGGADLAEDRERAAIADHAASADAGLAEPEDEKASSFRIPSGAPAALACDDARRVVQQVRKGLAFDPPAVRPSLLAASTIDWLDPHGLWSAAPGTPVAAAIERSAAALLRELELDPNGNVDAAGPAARCVTARSIGVVLAHWVKELRANFDRAHARAAGGDAKPTLEAAITEPILDGAATARSPTVFAALLGDRLAAIENVESGLGALAAPYATAARERFFPTLDAEGWSKVVLAAAVRAYVPLVDPHGAWAPLDEEASVYEVDLDSHPPVMLWEKVARTAIGARIEAGALAPLHDGDVLLSLAGVPTAGLPLEQIEQLAIVVADTRGSSEIVVLRGGAREPLVLHASPSTELTVSTGHDDLPSQRVPYADADVVVLSVHEVKDDLGEQMTRAVMREKLEHPAGGRPLAGFVIDLRGNGGGSTDGAISALGLFLPGASLFPMKRRDGTLETERAPEPALAERWTGPVATLVDANTASAAEMIAGALASYRRGVVVGRPTYGKGCAQEYQDDDARAGVLRITTLLYALPDGAPVQRVGLVPQIRVPFAPLPGEDASGESEAKLAGAPPTWRGPDVRDLDVVASSKEGTSWAATADVGPCRDADVCRALRALGGSGKSSRIAAAPASKPR